MSESQRKLTINKYWVDIHGERYLQVEGVDNVLSDYKDEESDNE